MSLADIELEKRRSLAQAERELERSRLLCDADRDLELSQLEEQEVRLNGLTGLDWARLVTTLDSTRLLARPDHTARRYTRLYYSRLQ